MTEISRRYIIDYRLYIIIISVYSVLYTLKAYAAGARVEEKRKKIAELQQYLEEDIPHNILFESYSGNLSDEIEELLISLETTYKQADAQDKKNFVKERIAALVANKREEERVEMQGERGRDKTAAHAPREMRAGITKLKLLSEKDAEQLYTLLQSSHEILEHEVDGITLPKTLEESITYIKAINDLFRQNKGYSYGMIDSGKLVGEICLVPVLEKYTKKIYEMGFRVAKQHSNQGYTTTAAKELKNLAFDTLDADFIVLNTQKNNSAANALAQTLGFELEPQNMYHDNEKNTRSKSSQGMIGNFFKGKKFVGDFVKNEYGNL